MHDRPVILLVGGAHADLMEQEFRARYDRDYRIETALGAEAGLERARELVADRAQIAMVAAEHGLGDASAIELLHQVPAVVATARRIALAPFEIFGETVDELRAAALRRDMDTFVLLPRGPRDEEFHTAIIELLSDWNWSVGRPVVTTTDIVAEPKDRDA
ncbi:MAG TPA: response regulator, partial [Promicromonospora sp.]|nr:response regulator [Promicromonospora sp.]